jgi:hypothetical protein
MGLAAYDQDHNSPKKVYLQVGTAGPRGAASLLSPNAASEGTVEPAPDWRLLRQGGPMAAGQHWIHHDVGYRSLYRRMAAPLVLELVGPIAPLFQKRERRGLLSSISS